MNNSQNYVKQIKNAKRGGYTPTLAKDINKHKDRLGHEYGLVDSRKYLAIACANWDIELTRDFLNHCIDTASNISSFGKPVINQSLIEVCQNSLKGKFSKAYLP